MNDKKLSPQESMALIGAMIEQSKHRVSMADVLVSALWGIITIVTATLVTILLLTMRDPVYNYGWFAIPAIGIPLNIFVQRRKGVPAVRTFIDTVRNAIWRTVGYLGLGLSAVCLGFNICGHPQAWLAMFYYAFIFVGFGSTATGLLIKEKSYTVGGIISIVAGFVIICAQLSGIALNVVWVMPLYVVCFFLMLIVPVFVLRRKLRNKQA